MPKFSRKPALRKNPSHFNEAWFEPYRQLGLKRAHAKRAGMPMCGAKARTTGEPCRQRVSEEGARCTFHGGATPRGKEWHRRQLPKRGTSLATWEKRESARMVRDRKAEARRAAMTPEERAAHEERRKPKRPGTPLERARRKSNREAKKLFAGLLAGDASTPSPDPAAEALAEEIRRLEQRKAELNIATATMEIFQ